MADQMDLTFADMDEMDFFERTLTWKLEHQQEFIVKRARSLAARLNRLADGLEADVNFSLNTLGELQGNGVELDVMCGAFGEKREQLKEIRKINERRHAKKEE